MENQKECKAPPSDVASGSENGQQYAQGPITSAGRNLILLLNLRSAEARPLHSCFWKRNNVASDSLPSRHSRAHFHWWERTTSSARRGCRESSCHSLNPCTRGGSRKKGRRHRGQSEPLVHPRAESISHRWRKNSVALGNRNRREKWKTHNHTISAFEWRCACGA